MKHHKKNLCPEFYKPVGIFHLLDHDFKAFELYNYKLGAILKLQNNGFTKE